MHLQIEITDVVYDTGKKRELTSGVFKQNLVVKAQPQLWHSWQEDTHLDGANDLTTENISIGTHLRNGEIEIVSIEVKSIEKYRVNYGTVAG